MKFVFLTGGAIGFLLAVVTGWLSNHWVTLHNDGNVAGYKPILVMDAWEHAFVPTYKPTERAKYVENILKDIDWAAVEKRLA